MDDDLIPVVAILMPLVLVLLVLGLRHLGRRREWEHKERMKAMERGLPLPGAENWLGRSVIAVGALMPVGVFGMAWLASMTAHRVEESVWLAASIVGGLGVLGGLRLASRLTRSHPGTNRDRDSHLVEQANGAGKKPSFNPDAYDVIAHRG